MTVRIKPTTNKWVLNTILQAGTDLNVLIHSLKFRKHSLTSQQLNYVQEGKYLTMHSTHFIYGYMLSDMW